MIGHVIDDEPAAHTGWWSQWHLAPLGRIGGAELVVYDQFPDVAIMRYVVRIQITAAGGS